MMSLLESHGSTEPHAAEAKQEVGPQEPSGDVWLRDSDPAEFLREVVDTLTGVLRADLEAGESKTTYVSPER
jgi:hypothetical protein